MIHTSPRTILEVFESLPEGTLCQVVNDRLVVSAVHTSLHQTVLKEIFFSLSGVVEKRNLGECLFGPLDVYLDSENIYQPDLIFISKDQLNILQNTVKGVPDLVIEILSKGSERLDKIEKKEVYERTGVKEYWIVEPETKKVWGYRLEGKLFKEILSQDGIIQSGLLNLTIQF